MKSIRGSMTSAALAVTLGLSVGCNNGGPTYEDRRPPTDSLADGNTGIEAKDVTAATDLFAHDLLGSPALNASQTQWTIVLTAVQNKTTDPTMTYSVFDGRLKSKLAQLGLGRVALIENKATYHNLQNQELESPPPSYGQGPDAGPGAAGVQPDYALYITIDQLPNRATDYFTITGQLTSLKTRQIVWVSPTYEFQSAR
jgi:hypothetical protein